MATYHRIALDSDAPTLGGVLYLGTPYRDWSGGRSARKAFEKDAYIRFAARHYGIRSDAWAFVIFTRPRPFIRVFFGDFEWEELEFPRPHWLGASGGDLPDLSDDEMGNVCMALGQQLARAGESRSAAQLFEISRAFFAMDGADVDTSGTNAGERFCDPMAMVGDGPWLLGAFPGTSVDEMRYLNKGLQSRGYARRRSEDLAYMRFAVRHYGMPDNTWCFVIFDTPDERYIRAFVEDERVYVDIDIPGKKSGEGPSGVWVEGQRPEFRPVDWLIQEAIEEEGQ